MSKEYIIIQTHSENNADSLSVERFTSAREAIFYFISYHCIDEEKCMDGILSNLTMDNEEEIEEKIQEKLNKLNDTKNILDEEERDYAYDDIGCYCDDNSHTSVAYEMWKKRKQLIRTLEETDIHFNMNKIHGEDTEYGISHIYITCGKRGTRKDGSMRSVQVSYRGGNDDNVLEEDVVQISEC